MGGLQSSQMNLREVTLKRGDEMGLERIAKPAL